ncbi:hypothetical protein [Mycobacterium sp. 1423905.2]|uniref:hypothetical protein n=1 Tax=Mycobacterium sp. 1423905.2 TaxID=1856859 RepID=UPI0007FEC08F|nr:hypothetical protein [Mycobacterium sp. 1423905.2]OBJ48082.1 hypothetical protein A9W95_05415 [Mycobacterium sp. 1423905.2]
MMLRKAPSARIRLRRRLCVFSAPVAVMLLLAAAKLITTGLFGHWAEEDFGNRDVEALRHDVAWLGVFDVIEPAKTAFAAGDMNVLAGRLRDAEDRFADSLSRTPPTQSCPARVNLLLVRETLGDLAFRDGNIEQAQRLYTAAIELATAAPAACFAGNSDPDADRRAVRADAIPRLQHKLDLLHRPALPPSAGPPQPPPGPPPAALTPPGLPEGGDEQNPNGPGSLIPISPDRLPVVDGGLPPGHRLGTGDPLDLLRKLLDNANAYGDNQE